MINLAMRTEKPCTKCKIVKPLEQFSLSYVVKTTGTRVLRSDCKTCNSTAAMEWQRRNPERTKRQKKAWRLGKEYGITLEAYEAMLSQQESKCALCGLDESRSHVGGGFYMLCVDHDHNTGVIRGLLCNNCNRGLGFLGDSVKGLNRAIAYLKKEVH